MGWGMASGGPGNDTIDAFNGSRNTISCGPGEGTVYFDRDIDKFISNSACEHKKPRRIISKGVTDELKGRGVAARPFFLFSGSSEQRGVTKEDSRGAWARVTLTATDRSVSHAKRKPSAPTFRHPTEVAQELARLSDATNEIASLRASCISCRGLGGSCRGTLAWSAS